MMDAIYKAIAEAQESGQSVGIRALHTDEHPVVGDIMPESNHWDDDVRSDESIGGTAAFWVSDPYDTDINEGGINAAMTYFCGQGQRYAVIVGDEKGSAGMPERHAMVFANAEVVAIIS